MIGIMIGTVVTGLLIKIGFDYVSMTDVLYSLYPSVR